MLLLFQNMNSAFEELPQDMKEVIVRLLKNWYTTPAHEVIQDHLENLPDKHIRPKEMHIGDMSWDAEHVLDDKIPDTPLEVETSISEKWV